MSPYADTATQVAYQRTWISSRRAEWLRGHFCEDCQVTDDLELHHRDPSKKLSHNVWSWGEARRDTELAKCTVLCRPCHQQRHSVLRRKAALARNPHGTRQRCDLGCKCRPCLDAKAAYNRAHPAKSKGAAA